MKQFDAWWIARSLANKPVGNAQSLLSPEWRKFGEHLASLPAECRAQSLQALECVLPDFFKFEQTLAASDPTLEFEDLGIEIEQDLARCANIGDIRRVVKEARQIWPGWLASGVLIGLAADPGTGKTIFALDLARRLWLGMEWPDGQPNPFPRETKTLWVPGDRHYPQLTDLAAAYGMPDEAILLNATSDNPTGGLDLDDEAELKALAERIATHKPGLVIIDTVGMTTCRNLCRPEEARGYFGPLVEMATKTGTSFLCLTHLSKDGDALGRRITGVVRILLKMNQPDPEDPDTRQIFVDKSYLSKPPALSMKITAGGCTFNHETKKTQRPMTGGRPADERTQASKFLLDRLKNKNDQSWQNLACEWENTGKTRKTLLRAVEDLKESGQICTDGGRGMGASMILHLYTDADPNSNQKTDSHYKPEPEDDDGPPF